MICQHDLCRHPRLALVALLAGLAIGWPAPVVRAQSNPICAPHNGGDTVVVSTGTTETCNILAFNTGVIVEKGASVEGDVVVFWGNAQIDGVVTGDVNVGFGTLAVDGTVQGSAWASDALTLTKNAVVGRTAGTLQNLHREPGARIEEVVASNAPDPRATSRRWPIGLGALAMVLSAALFAALAVNLAPDPVSRIRVTTQRGGVLSFFVGAVLTLALVPLFLASVMQPVVWPLWLIVGLVWLAATALGGLGLADRLGRWVLSGRSRATQAAVGAALLALAPALFGAAGLLGICLGALVGFVPVFTSTGAGVLSVFGSHTWPRGLALADGEPAGDAAGKPLAPTLPGTPPSGAAEAAPTDGAAPAEDELWRQPAYPLDEVDLAPPVGGEPGTWTPTPSGLGGEVPGLAPGAIGGSEPDSPPLPTAPAGGEAPVQRPVEAEPPTTAAPPWTPALPAADQPATEAAGAAQGDLGQVAAITPIFAHLLAEAGIGTLGELAAASPARVLEAVSRPGVTPVTEAMASDWIAAAKTQLAG